MISKDINLVFQTRLNLLVSASGKKLPRIAHELGISRSALWKYLYADNKIPSAPIAIALAEYFNVSLRWLAGLTNDKEPYPPWPGSDKYMALSPDAKKSVDDYVNFLSQREQTSKND